MTLTKCFKKISVFLKWGKRNQTWGILNFLENGSKDFSHFLPECTAEYCLSAHKNSLWKQKSLRIYFWSKMHQDKLLHDPLL